VRNDDVAATLNALGDLLEIKGENRFRVNAYRDAARNVESLSESLEQILAQGRIREIPGVGEAIALKVQELLETGKLDYYERLKAEVPDSLRELLQIPGLGPKKVKLVYDSLKVRDLNDFRTALADGRIAALPGMGEKTVQNLQREVERFQQRGSRHPLGDALPLVQGLMADLRVACPWIWRMSEGGSVRRRRETIGDLDIIVASERQEEVLDAFVRLPMVQEVIGHGDTKASILGPHNQQVDLRAVPREAWGAALLYFTGSKAHNVKLREMGIRRGWRLNEYGLTVTATSQVIAAAEEADIYAAFGLPVFPPEMREDTGEIEAALAGRLPRVVEIGEIRGELHSHSDWSDGQATIETMWEAAKARGLEFLALTDHTQSLGVANGLTVDRLRQQRKIVDEINRRASEPRLLHGVELEIRADGTLDFPDEVLAGLDVVVASVHSGFAQTKEKMTARLLAAARNPNVDVIGHPSGRLIGRRESYEVDLEALMRACAETGTALEINANPSRLDLDDVHARRAIELGCWLAIDTDAHAPDNFDLLQYGVATARRAWVTPDRVLNCLSLDALLAYLGRQRKA
jgi:DNA polymerase (family 10)